MGHKIDNFKNKYHYSEIDYFHKKNHNIDEMKIIVIDTLYEVHIFK